MRSGASFALKNLYLSHTFDRNIELSYQQMINNIVAASSMPYELLTSPQIEGNVYTYWMSLNTTYTSTFYSVLIVKQSKNENTETIDFKFNIYNHK